MVIIRPVEAFLEMFWEDFKEQPIPWLKFLLWEVPIGLLSDLYNWWSATPVAGPG